MQCSGCCVVSRWRCSHASWAWRHRLAAWRDEFLEAGKQGLKGQRADRSQEDRQLKDAERKVGQLTLENEILRAAAEKRGLQIPPAKRPR
jgi:hypothetical protein